MSRPTRIEAPKLNGVAEAAAQILVLLFATAMVAQPYVIPTPSMTGSLLVGDHLIVDKLAYAPAGEISRYLLPYMDVERGDIVVFHYPLDISENYVKRVIGVPGDRIRIVDRQLYRNGQAVDEPYKTHQRDYSIPILDNFNEVMVPEGHYFVMGDNRDNSEDSRVWGFVPRQNIIGKPVLIWWSYDAATERLVDGNVNPEHLLDIALNFFSKTRWERTFRLIRPHRYE